MQKKAETAQDSLFPADGRKGVEVLLSRFEGVRTMDYRELFGGFAHLKVITFSYGLGFVSSVADMFEDVEIVLGSVKTVRPDIVDVAAHQKIEMKRISKQKRLVERVEEGSVRLYFNMRKMSHEKLYLLSSDDGRCRVVIGSANLSKRAFTGGQHENIACYDGDEAMYGNRLARFEAIKALASTTPLEPAVLADFTRCGEDGFGNVPVFRSHGIVYLCDEGEPEGGGETYYTFDAADMTEEEREQVEAMRREKVSYRPVPNGRIVLADEVRRVLRASDTAAREYEAKVLAYPRFRYDAGAETAYLNDKPYEIPAQGAWMTDAHAITELIGGYDAFVGDVETTKQQLFKVLAFMFTAPFMTRMKEAARRKGYPIERYPQYCIFYGDSNAGKSTFTELCLQLMYGSTDVGRIPHKEWTKTGIGRIDRLCPQMALVIDDMQWKRFSANAEAIIKDDRAPKGCEDACSPLYVLTVNEMGSIKPQLAKRSVPVRTDVRIDREAGIETGKMVNDALSELTCAFFLEYLKRMAPQVDDMEARIEADEKGYSPDLLHLSSATLDAMLRESGDDAAWHRPLTVAEFNGETATARNVRNELLEAWRVDSSQFKVRTGGQGVEYRPNGASGDRMAGYRLKGICEELPAYLEAKQVNDVIVFRNTAALERFLGVALDRGMRARMRRMVESLRGEGKNHGR